MPSGAARSARHRAFGLQKWKLRRFVDTANAFSSTIIELTRSLFEGNFSLLSAAVGAALSNVSFCPQPQPQAPKSADPGGPAWGEDRNPCLHRSCITESCRRLLPGGGWGVPGAPRPPPGRPQGSGGVSIRCTITVFARLLGGQGGIKREPAAPGGSPGRAPAPDACFSVAGAPVSVLRGISGGSFGVRNRSFSVLKRSQGRPDRSQSARTGLDSN